MTLHVVNDLGRAVESTGYDSTDAVELEEAVVASDSGMSTVEYAIGTVVAAAFAAVLYRIVTGDSIVAGLTSLVQSALNTDF